MDYKEFREFDKQFYQAMKLAVKTRKAKLSAEHDIYRKIDPYFFSSSYHLMDVADGKATFTLIVSVKYHRFDELEWGIIEPGDELRFTDKIRANSVAACNATLSRFEYSFDCDGSVESIPNLCEALLNYLTRYYTDFLSMVEREYGDLNDYYIAHKEESPRLAGLAYLDRGDKEAAAECFASPNMDGANSSTSPKIHTDEQRKRALASNMTILQLPEYEFIWRSMKDEFSDFAVALRNGIEWTKESAMYGLLPEERQR